jgi:hypothetical protein
MYGVRIYKIGTDSSSWLVERGTGNVFLTPWRKIAKAQIGMDYYSTSTRFRFQVERYR